MKTGIVGIGFMTHRTWAAVILIGVILSTAGAITAYAADTCGPDPCPGTLPAIWSRPSKPVPDTLRILGWNLTPGTYEIVVVRPDGLVLPFGFVTTDAEGAFLGDENDTDGQPYVCKFTASDLEVSGDYQVLLYPLSQSGSPDEAPVAATSFCIN